MAGSQWWNGRVWNAANLLTMVRLLVSPFAVRAIVLDRPRRAFILIFVAGFTDLLDGLVARWTRSETELGQYLDPVADKLLLSGVFVGLAWIHSVPAWFVGIVFGRDLLLLLASCFVMLFTSYSNLKPTIYGKASTLFQIFTAGLFVAANAFGSGQWKFWAKTVLWPAAALTVISGVQYGWRGLRYFLRRPQPAAN
jgi:cardiolipin synthase